MVAQALPNHRHFTGRQMPARRPWREMKAIEIVILMAGAALDNVGPVSIRPTLDLHGVRMAVITLARIVAGRMTVHTSRMTQDRNDPFERSRSCDIVSLCRFG